MSIAKLRGKSAIQIQNDSSSAINNNNNLSEIPINSSITQQSNNANIKTNNNNNNNNVPQTSLLKIEPFVPNNIIRLRKPFHRSYSTLSSNYFKRVIDSKNFRHHQQLHKLNGGIGLVPGGGAPSVIPPGTVNGIGCNNNNNNNNINRKSLLIRQRSKSTINVTQKNRIINNNNSNGGGIIIGNVSTTNSSTISINNNNNNNNNGICKINRPQKEQEKLPDRINYDRRGLTSIPIFENEKNLRLLSLQHNLINIFHVPDDTIVSTTISIITGNNVDEKLIINNKKCQSSINTVSIVSPGNNNNNTVVIDATSSQLRINQQEKENILQLTSSKINQYSQQQQQQQQYNRNLILNKKNGLILSPTSSSTTLPNNISQIINNNNIQLSPNSLSVSVSSTSLLTPIGTNNNNSISNNNNNVPTILQKPIRLQNANQRYTTLKKSKSFITNYSKHLNNLKNNLQQKCTTLTKNCTDVVINNGEQILDTHVNGNIGIIKDIIGNNNINDDDNKLIENITQKQQAKNNNINELNENYKIDNISSSSTTSVISPSYGTVFQNLVFLDLYDNQIEKIINLDGFKSLTVLLLGKNRITDITGLASLKCTLRVLDLHGNKITTITNKINCLQELKSLNLAGNQIRQINQNDFNGLMNLKELNLKRNKIKRVYGFNHLISLERLWLCHNDLHKVEDMSSIAKAINLQEVTIENNPVSLAGDCVSFLVSYLPQLIMLSQMQITDQVRRAAMAWRKNKEISDSNFTNLTSDVFNSIRREEVISNARTNWELLRSQQIMTSGNPININTNNVSKMMANNNNHKLQTVPENSDKFFTNDTNLLTSNNNNNKMKIPKIQQDKIDINNQNCNSTNSTNSYNYNNIKDDLQELFRLPPITHPYSGDSNQSSEKTRHSSGSSLGPNIDSSSSCFSSDNEDKDCLITGAIENNYEKRSSRINKKTTNNKNSPTGAVIAIPGPLRTSIINEQPPFEFEKILYDVPLQIDNNNFKEVTVIDETINTTLTICHQDNNVLIKNNIDENKILNLSENNCNDNNNCYSDGINNLNQNNDNNNNINTNNNIDSNSQSDKNSNLSGSNGKTESEISIISTIVNTSGSSSASQQNKQEQQQSTSTAGVQEKSNSTSLKNPRQNGITTKRYMQGSLIRSQTTKPNRTLSNNAFTGNSTSNNTGGSNNIISNGNSSSNGGFLTNRSGANLNNSNSTTTGTKQQICEREREQGGDYLIEICGRYLNIYGMGALRFIDKQWNLQKSFDVNTINFSYINFNNIATILCRIKLRFPNALSFVFRETNICCLGQLNALAELQGIQSLVIDPEGNPITLKDWRPYSIYRLSHWGLKYINGIDVTDIEIEMAQLEYSGLSDLVLWSLPDTMLQPLLQRLRLEETCSASKLSAKEWLMKSDQSLKNVVGKEALQWKKSNSTSVTANQDEYNMRERGRKHFSLMIENTCNAVEKLHKLEVLWPNMLLDIIKNTLIDYSQLDGYLKNLYSEIMK